MKIVSDYKLICFSDKYHLYSKGPRLYVSRGIDERLTKIATLPVGAVKSTLGSIRGLARALRLEPRCGTFVDKSTAIVSYHGAIYRVDCDNGDIVLEHRFRPEMNNPLVFTHIKGVYGFTDAIYYGEYFLNHEGAPVHIWRREASGEWKVVFTFPAGSVYHIHGLVPCWEEECVYVLTGDKDVESGIFEARNDFLDMHAVVTGKQAYRACVALPVENGLLYTTDTPLEDNYLYHLDMTTKEISVVAPIAGPCIYGKVISPTEMVFSTSVEPDSRIKGIKYEFTNVLGPGVKDRSTHLYYVKWDGSKADIKEIFTAEKDALPMGAGQFGTMMFPDGEDKLFVTCQAVKKYDNKTLLFDNEGLLDEG